MSSKAHKKANSDKVKEYQKRYRLANKNKRNIKVKERLDCDSVFKLTSYVRSGINQAFRRKSYTKKSKTHQILGCSFIELKFYLEAKFEPWMSWDNYGRYNGELNYGWDIDHIIPLSSAKTEEEVIALSHHTNLQPLCSKINRDIKKNIIS